MIHKLDVDGHGAYALTDLGRHTDLLLRELSRFVGLLDPEDALRILTGAVAAATVAIVAGLWATSSTVAST